jgi:Glu-tRNA(Gln) amidotransferase subunit E-like FAD-binding protein
VTGQLTHVPRNLREWREELLREAGFHPELARELARDGRIDLHEALELVDRGCPPDLAARILAPL